MKRIDHEEGRALNHPTTIVGQRSKRAVARQDVQAAPYWRHMGGTAKRQVSELRDRINLRLSRELLVAIDAARAKRAGQVSRNTWIAEAIAEKLRRDRKNKGMKT